MHRLGLAASKMAKGNLVVYNLFVFLLSFLFSLLIFFIAGSSVLLALIIMAFLVNGVMPLEFENNWGTVIRVCMVTLTVMIGCFNLLAILKNIRLNLPQDEN